MKDTVVFTFGRFNPPTTGHEKLIEKLASVAKKEGADFMVFPSHSQNDKKDPLDHKTKVGFMKKMFPKYSRNIISNRNAKTAFMIAPMLYDMGYKRCIMVVGGDRVTEFKTTLNKYNGKKGSHGFYDFKGGIEIVSAGERDPDAEGVTGMSASKMRAAAAANDYDSFKNGLPSSFEKSNGKKLFDALRKAMNISEELSEFLEATNSDFSRFIETEFVEIVEDIEDEMLIESVYKELDFKIGIDDDYATVYKRIYNNEEVSQKQIDDLEKFADRMLAKYDIDVTFTRHFVDRMNDTRNDPEIKVAELQKFFKKIQKKKGSQIKANPDIEAVLKDMSTNLNLPVVINYKDGEFEVVHKTIMRKKNFSTSSKELKYESLEEANYQVDIEGLPTFYVNASSAGEVKNDLRKLLKNPKVIKDVEKVTDGEIKKDFRDRITGKDEGVSRAQQAAIAIAKKKSGKYDKDGNKLEDCWTGFKQVGMKKKNGKDVPNCVPEDFKMNPEREKDLENIAKDLPDDDFKKRYGDEWMQVKMATAMNILKKKLGYSTEDLEEDVMKAANEDAEIKSFSQFLFERKTTQDPDIKNKEKKESVDESKNISSITNVGYMDDGGGTALTVRERDAKKLQADLKKNGYEKHSSKRKSGTTMTHFIFKSKGKPDIYISFDGQDGTSYVSYDKDVFESVDLGEGFFDKLKSAPHVAKAGVAANKGDLQAVKGHVSNAVPDHITGDDREKLIKKHYANLSKATKNTNMKTILKKMSESVDLGEARAKQAVAGSKVQKLVTAHGLKFKGKVYKEIDMELVKINNNTQMVTFNIIHPREIFGNETNISFKALKRGPFMATDTSKIITGGETRTTGDADLWAKVKK